jgi:hypothetical protein
MKKKHSLKQNSPNAVLNRGNKGQFKKCTHWRPHAIFRERDYLDREYSIKQRSASDIAKEHGVTENAILFWISKHGIKTRTVSETRAIKHWGANGESNPMFGRCGSANPRWIDGSSPERQKMYARSFWKDLIKLVYSRDGYKCQKCGSPHTYKNRLHAHHVKPWAGNVDTRFDLANIITVCQSCHNWIHSKANTRNEFLSS